MAAAGYGGSRLSAPDAAAGAWGAVFLACGSAEGPTAAGASACGAAGGTETAGSSSSDDEDDEESGDDSELVRLSLFLQWSTSVFFLEALSLRYGIQIAAGVLKLVTLSTVAGRSSSPSIVPVIVRLQKTRIWYYIHMDIYGYANMRSEMRMRAFRSWLLRVELESAVASGVQKYRGFAARARRSCLIRSRLQSGTDSRIVIESMLYPKKVMYWTGVNADFSKLTV